MTEQEDDPSAKPKKTNSILPDTVFKILTRQEMDGNKLRVGESEVQHISRSDLVIEVPAGVELKNTLFEFCSPITVMEFKSQNDPFNVEEFVVNQTRTSVLFLQALARARAERKKRKNNAKDEEKVAEETSAASSQGGTETDELEVLPYYAQFLNVYVVARYPKDFLALAKTNGIIFEPDQQRNWLRWAKVGFQKMALVVCRDLPIEKRFYNWLLFAPSEGKKWEAFVQRLRLEGEKELLEFARTLRPKEFEMIKMNAAELWEKVRQEGALTPEVEAQLAQERAEAVQILLGDLENKDPYQMAVVFDDMNQEQASQLINSLSSIRLAALVNYLEPAQRERVVGLVKSDKQRQWLELLLAEQNPGK